MKRLTVWSVLSIVVLCLVTLPILNIGIAQKSTTSNAKQDFIAGQPPSETPDFEQFAPLGGQPPGGPGGPPPGGQPPGGPGGPQPGGRPGFQGGPPGGPGAPVAPGGMMGMQPRPGMGGAPAQMAVSGDNVYVLRGNKIYRLNASSLKVQATGELPDDRPAPPRDEQK